MIITDTVVQPIPVPFSGLAPGDVFFHPDSATHGLKLLGPGSRFVNLETSEPADLPGTLMVYLRASAELTLG